MVAPNNASTKIFAITANVSLGRCFLLRKYINIIANEIYNIVAQGYDSIRWIEEFESSADWSYINFFYVAYIHISVHLVFNLNLILLIICSLKKKNSQKVISAMIPNTESRHNILKNYYVFKNWQIHTFRGHKQWALTKPWQVHAGKLQRPDDWVPFRGKFSRGYLIHHKQIEQVSSPHKDYRLPCLCTSFCNS